jgi:hypothetical protein
MQEGLCRKKEWTGTAKQAKESLHAFLQNILSWGPIPSVKQQIWGAFFCPVPLHHADTGW